MLNTVDLIPAGWYYFLSADMYTLNYIYSKSAIVKERKMENIQSGDTSMILAELVPMLSKLKEDELLVILYFVRSLIR